MIYNPDKSPIPFSPPPRFVSPNGKRCAVMVCFDVDGETTALCEDPALANRLTTMSQCEYGPRVGVPRILALLEHLQLPATFFIPSYIAEQHPRMSRAIAEAGHEIGAHGHLHEKLHGLTEEEETRVLRKSLTILEKVLGKRPCGYRVPWFEINPWTVELLGKEGLLYNDSLMGDDVPFLHPNGLVEIPSN